jgi:hypothetical protein
MERVVDAECKTLRSLYDRAPRNQTSLGVLAALIGAKSVVEIPLH